MGVRTNMLSRLLFLATDLSIHVLSCGLKAVWTFSCTVSVRTSCSLSHSNQGQCYFGQKPAKVAWLATYQPWLTAYYLRTIYDCPLPRRDLFQVCQRKIFENSCKVGRMKTHPSNSLRLLQGCPQDTDETALYHLQPCTHAAQLEPHSNPESPVNY